MQISCPVCGTDFYASPSEIKRGQGKYCGKDCFSTIKRQRSKELSTNRTSKVCPRCGIEKGINLFAINRTKALGLGRQSWCKDCMNKNKIQFKYGLTYDEVNTLKVKGCFICGSKDRLIVDHNHNTEKIRGILCNDCNAGLGFFKDSKQFLRKAVEYLDATDNVQGTSGEW